MIDQTQPRRRTLVIRMIVMLVVVGIVAGGIIGFQIFKAHIIAHVMAGFKNPPQTVSTTVAAEQDWQSQLKAVGSVRAVNGANISAQVAGIVSAIHFDSGQDVKAGTLLVELVAGDDIAKLQSLKATAALAKITYDRDQRQLKAQAVSQQTVDADAQNLKSAQAQVDEQQALVNYKSIRAPFDGHLGIRQVDLGQYLAAGTPIVTLQALDPIFVDFYLPEQAINQIKVKQTVAVTVDTYPGQTFTGEIVAISPLVDSATRNVQVRATFKNPDHKLLPGMFAATQITVGAPQRYITLPQTAITYNAYGDTVFLINQSGKDAKGQPLLSAKQTFITLGDTRGDQVAVLSGVKAGDTVVTSGQLKLHNGTPVLVDNSVQPSNDANPKPVDQ